MATHAAYLARIELKIQEIEDKLNLKKGFFCKKYVHSQEELFREYENLKTLVELIFSNVEHWGYQERLSTEELYIHRLLNKKFQSALKRVRILIANRKATLKDRVEGLLNEIDAGCGLSSSYQLMLSDIFPL